jgi:c-di-GMP-binding flagellar brake protein YcgR
MAPEDQTARLQINDMARITIRNPDETRNATYLGCVKEGLSDGYLFELTTRTGKQTLLKNGDRLFITFIIQGWTYGFDAAAIEIKQARKSFVRVRSDGPVERIQRRNYVRIVAPVDIKVFELYSEAGRSDMPVIDTKIINLSGSGFAIHHQHPLSIGSLFEVELKIPEGIPLLAKARVIWCNSLEGPTQGPSAYRSGFAFVNLGEVARRRIISHLIALQQQTLCVDPEQEQ